MPVWRLREQAFTSIGNLQGGIKGLLTKDVPSGIYHMGDDEALSTNELIEVICSALGKKARIWRVPEGLMLFAYYRSTIICTRNILNL